MSPPLARALLGKTVGDSVRAGNEQAEITAIDDYNTPGRSDLGPVDADQHRAAQPCRDRRDEIVDVDALELAAGDPDDRRVRQQRTERRLNQFLQQDAQPPGGFPLARSVPGRERVISVLANGTVTGPTRRGSETVSM